jgi:tripartite-type tricarboxylate transporter receptor subunit TctC
LAQWLSERLGQQFVIENRSGAETNIATETAIRSPADGYTLLMANSTKHDQRFALRAAQF